MKGKILLVLVNDPPAPASEPKLFGGKAMTYYGRWTYKYEEAERRGAAGVLIVHTTEAASYPWHTVVGSWAKEQRMLPRDPAEPAAARRARLDHRQRGHRAARAGRAQHERPPRAGGRRATFKPVRTGHP